MFTLRYDETMGSFDEAPLQAFFQDKQIVSVSDHFFVHEGQPGLALVITYKLGQLPEPGTLSKKTPKDRETTWRKLLRPEDYPMFDTLREWRRERCKVEGVPPYVVCTNEHLAKMVRMKPENLTDLSRIEGFGKSKREKYGKEMLEILTGRPGEVGESTDPATQDPSEKPDA